MQLLSVKIAALAYELLVLVEKFRNVELTIVVHHIPHQCWLDFPVADGQLAKVIVDRTVDLILLHHTTVLFT